MDSKQLVIDMERLAAIAALEDLSDQTPLLQGWDLVVIFPAPTKKQSNPELQVQGFLAKGPVTGSNDVIAVLALGINWASFQLDYFIGPLSRRTQVSLSEYLPSIKGFPKDGMIDGATLSGYMKKREDLWKAISHDHVKDLPLFIGGMGLGAPSAQLAALDFMPGNTGPNGQDAPLTQPTGHYFSAGNVANYSYAHFFNSHIAGQSLHAVHKKGLTIDFFPTRPNNNDYSPLGNPQSVPSKMPVFDDPWWERSDCFYLQALGGAPDKLPVETGHIDLPPEGYSPLLASMLATLCAVSYQAAQHWDLIPVYTGYELIHQVNSGGSPFAFIFSNNRDAVVLAFRGSSTWEEFTSFVACSENKAVPFLKGKNASMRKGVYDLYYALTDPIPGAITFEQDIKNKLKTVMSGDKRLYITGHSLGGALANLAAADYALSPESDIDPTAIYTFGATLLADHGFFTLIEAKLAQKSYQIVRQRDQIANAVHGMGFWQLQQQLSLTGQMKFEDSTYHSLTGYLGMLDPWQRSDLFDYPTHHPTIGPLP